MSESVEVSALAKNQLQEIYQQRNETLPTYRTDYIGGEMHEPLWGCAVTLNNGMVFKTERGYSKKKVAEHVAATMALAYLAANPDPAGAPHVASPMSSSVGSASAVSPGTWRHAAGTRVPVPGSVHYDAQSVIPPVHRRMVGVFWDVENVGLPKQADVVRIGQELLALSKTFGDVMKMEAITGSSSALTPQHRNHLSNVGIDCVHSPVAKEAADKALIVSVLMWLWDVSRSTAAVSRVPCVILITGDHDFCSLLHKIRMRGVFTVLITRVERVRQELSGAADTVIDFVSAIVHLTKKAVEKSKQQGRAIDQAAKRSKESKRAGSKSPVKTANKSKASIAKEAVAEPEVKSSDAESAPQRRGRGKKRPVVSDSTERNPEPARATVPAAMEEDFGGGDAEMGARSLAGDTDAYEDGTDEKMNIFDMDFGLMPPEIRRFTSENPQLKTLEQKVEYMLKQEKGHIAGHEVPHRYQALYGVDLKSEIKPGKGRLKKLLQSIPTVRCEVDKFGLPVYSYAASDDAAEQMQGSSLNLESLADIDASNQDDAGRVEVPPEFEDQMAVLIEMGFKNKAKNLAGLKRHNGDVEQMVKAVSDFGSPRPARDQ